MKLRGDNILQLCFILIMGIAVNRVLKIGTKETSNFLDILKLVNLIRHVNLYNVNEINSKLSKLLFTESVGSYEWHKAFQCSMGSQQLEGGVLEFNTGFA